MAKIVVFYYTQTGQLLDIAESVCKPLAEAGNEIIYKQIVPENPFSFPWTSDSFFQAFPESREGIPCAIKPIDFSDIENADLVIIAYQAWFLSPSIPFHAFFQNKQVQEYLHGKNVVTIDGCRNMWVMAHIKIKSYLNKAGAKLVGNIVLQDRHQNLVSVITIVRWLLYGKKEKGKLFPAAGISDKDIKDASCFGKIISENLEQVNFENLQTNLMQAKAIEYKPSIVFIEKNGHRIFGIWSKFILRKGNYNSPKRNLRLSLFKYYLFAVLYLVSPIGLLVFYLTYPFRYRTIQKDKQLQCFFTK